MRRVSGGVKVFVSILCILLVTCSAVLYCEIKGVDWIASIDKMLEPEPKNDKSKKGKKR